MAFGVCSKQFFDIFGDAGGILFIQHIEYYTLLYYVKYVFFAKRYNYKNIKEQNMYCAKPKTLTTTIIVCLLKLLVTQNGVTLLTF